MTKYCKCGHRKDRHQRAARNWPIRYLDCEWGKSLHQFEEKKGDKE
jgi:hypothetical protein